MLDGVDVTPLQSFSQHGEDLYLHYLLSDVDRGTYVDVGAWDPDLDSVSKFFHLRGWRGLHVEPLVEEARALQKARPDDAVYNGVVGAPGESSAILYVVHGTGLSTVDAELAARHLAHGHMVSKVEVPKQTLDSLFMEFLSDGGPLHWVKIDVEGAEKEVLEGFNLLRWNPWVICMEAADPANPAVSTSSLWEHLILSRGWVLATDDGLNRFYVAPEQAWRVRL